MRIYFGNGLFIVVSVIDFIFMWCVKVENGEKRFGGIWLVMLVFILIIFILVGFIVNGYIVIGFVIVGVEIFSFV